MTSLITTISFQQRRLIALTLVTLIMLTLAFSASYPLRSLHAQGNLDGTYTLTGTDLEGKDFNGEFTLSAEKDVYHFASQNVPGVALFKNNTLAIAFGEQCGVALYGVAPDGTLNGVWAYQNNAYAGTERGIPDGGTNSLSNYQINGTLPSGNPYRGILRIGQNASVFDLTWISSGNNNKGVGVVANGRLGATFGAANCGLMMFQLQSDGTLSGQWTVTGQNKVGSAQAALKGSGDSSSGNSGNDPTYGLGNGEGNASEGNSSGDNSGNSGASEASLAVNAEAEVTEAGNELYLLKSAEVGAKRQTVLLTGDVLLLVDGPLEKDGYTWWQVKTVDGRTGYVMQGIGQGDQYVAWIAASTHESIVQADSTESALYMGARCTLGEGSKFTVTVRDQPSRGAQAIKRIEDNAHFVVIIGGPVVADERRWWQVRLGADSGPDADDERTGWIAEEAEAVLTPLQSPEAVLTVKGGNIQAGSNIRVTGSGGELPMHQDPDVKTTPISTLDQASDATVISGPTQAQGFTWWEVKRVKDGIRGWIAVAPGWIENYNG